METNKTTMNKTNSFLENLDMESWLLCVYLFPSNPTEIHIATKTNETNTKKKSFKTARCCCDGKVIIMSLSISKSFQVFSKIRPRMC